MNHVARGTPVSPVFGRIVPETRPLQSSGPSGIHDQLIQSQHADVIPQQEVSSANDFPALGIQMQRMRIEDCMACGDSNAYRVSPSERNLAQQARGQLSSAKADAHLPRNVQVYGFPDRHRAPRQEERPSHPSHSPSARTLGPLDAQLPASLDSNGLSWFARHGPVAASVPHTTTFGIPERFTSQASSPLPSVTIQPSTSLFAASYGTSPRQTTLGRAMFERRASAINDRSDDHDGAFEEDFVPSSLNELLTPAERQRRYSRGADDILSKSPTGSTSGSPSSSRFGLLFSKHKAAESSIKSSPSQILPIGSPLARSHGTSAPSALSPPRMQRNSSSLRTDMKPSAKEFSFTKEKDFKNEDETFEMDI